MPPPPISHNIGEHTISLGKTKMSHFFDERKYFIIHECCKGENLLAAMNIGFSRPQQKIKYSLKIK